MAGFPIHHFGVGVFLGGFTMETYILSNKLKHLVL